MLRRRRKARRPRSTLVPAMVPATEPAAQTGIPRAIHAGMHHEPRRRSRQPAGYAHGTYLPRPRRSGSGSRSLFRVT